MISRPRFSGSDPIFPQAAQACLCVWRFVHTFRGMSIQAGRTGRRLQGRWPLPTLEPSQAGAWQSHRHFRNPGWPLDTQIFEASAASLSFREHPEAALFPQSEAKACICVSLNV